MPFLVIFIIAAIALDVYLGYLFGLNLGLKFILPILAVYVIAWLLRVNIWVGIVRCVGIFFIVGSVYGVVNNPETETFLVGEKTKTEKISISNDVSKKTDLNQTLPNTEPEKQEKNAFVKFYEAFIDYIND